MKLYDVLSVVAILLGVRILYFDKRKKRSKGAEANTQIVTGTDCARKRWKVVEGAGTDGGTNGEGAEMSMKEGGVENNEKDLVGSLKRRQRVF
jgi:hypothetical protein